MDSWKKSCNYKQEKDAKGNITSYIIMVDKVPVKVTKEIYQMYSQSSVALGTSKMNWKQVKPYPWTN